MKTWKKTLALILALALAAGLCACEANIAGLLGSNLHEVAPYISRDNHQFNQLSIQFSGQVWDAMSPELQEAMRTAAREDTVEQVAYMLELEESLVDKIEEGGGTVLPTSEIDVASLQALVGPVYESAREKIGAEFFDGAMDFLHSLNG